jgi:hypothetical protein
VLTDWCKKKSAGSGYVAISRCPVIFDGTNCPDFAAFMRIHMHGLRLWGVLSGEILLEFAHKSIT